MAKRIMYLEFKLSMPNVGSWNGKWSGEGTYYAIVKRLKFDKAEEVLKHSSYYYGWDDGWGALVKVTQIDAKQARKIQKLSSGFCGYDWMVDSIISFGKILNSKQQKNLLNKEV